MPIVRKNVSEIDGIVLSYSRVNSYFDCPLAYKYHYIDKLPEEPSIPMMLGSLTHAILERVFQEEIDGNPLPDIDNISIPLWEEIISQNDPEGKLEPDKCEEAFNLAKTLAETYLKEPDLPVLTATETHYITEKPVLITDMAKYYLQGYIDGEIDMDKEYTKILDYKTSKSKWGEYDAENEFQPNFYGLLLDAENIEMTYPILLKHKTPKIQWVITKRNKKQIHTAEKLIRIYAHCTENQLYYPKRGGWKCNPNYCAYYKQCHEW